MSSARFIKPVSAQYSDLFVRRSDSARGNDSASDAAVPTVPSPTLFRALLNGVLSAWRWIDRKRTQQSALRRLRISETISLGDKRFVSILEVNGAQYLIGGAANQISLLAVLHEQAGENSSEGSESARRQA